MLRTSLGVLLIIVLQAAGHSDAATLDFSFALDHACTTSAGAYQPDGTLVRTLWRKEAFASGTHTKTWDGLDDQGDAVPAGAYQIRVLAHNVDYVWEGVIGNTSKSFTGPGIWKTYAFASGLSATGTTVYTAAGYNEAQNCFMKFSSNDPQERTTLYRADPFTAFPFVTTDGVRSYWATDGGGIWFGGSTRYPCFVLALNVVDDTQYRFPFGKDVALQGDYADQKHFGVIDFSAGSLTSAATGISVQRNGDLLAVAHGREDKILLYHKVSGEFIKSLDNVPLSDGTPTEAPLAMAANGDLWALCGTTARRYTDLAGTPTVAATITDLSAGLAIAAHPTDNNLILVNDGGCSQQVKAFNSEGEPLWTLGQPGGYADNSTVTNDRFGLGSALCVMPDGSFWLGDGMNTRLLHFSSARVLIESVSYLTHCYVSTVDLSNPSRVFASFQEYEVDYSKPLKPGPDGPWRLVKNWAAGLGKEDTDLFAAGLRAVVTLSNGRTYALLNDPREVVELTSTGKLRKTGIKVEGAIYADGSVRYSNRDDGTQTIYQRTLTGFDTTANPQWGPATVLAIMPDGEGDPTYRGAYSGPLPARWPITESDVVISFDPGVQGNTGFHLGGAAKGGSGWRWKASPTDWLNGTGNFQTKEIDGSVQYGGNQVWASGRNVVYGYHGEFWMDQPTRRVGQANRFMHWWDDGLFVGEFGVGHDNVTPIENPPGKSGNPFSPALVNVKGITYLYHNDESTHGGVHRWRLDGADRIEQLVGSGTLGQDDPLVCRRH